MILSIERLIVIDKKVILGNSLKSPNWTHNKIRRLEISFYFKILNESRRDSTRCFEQKLQQLAPLATKQI